jgi:hypothetical protein
MLDTTPHELGMQLTRGSPLLQVQGTDKDKTSIRLSSKGGSSLLQVRCIWLLPCICADDTACTALGDTLPLYDPAWRST